MVQSGIVASQLVVPRFILQDLQETADSADKLLRARGRRGLDVLTRLREGKQDVVLYENPDRQPTDAPADQQLIDLAAELNARVLTTDENLKKVSQLRGVEVPVVQDGQVVPGERMTVTLVKPGESAGQGVGYLEDGTMVVVEQGKSRLQQEVDVTVTSALQTSAGRMIFARLNGDDGANRQRADLRPGG